MHHSVIYRLNRSASHSWMTRFKVIQISRKLNKRALHELFIWSIHVYIGVCQWVCYIQTALLCTQHHSQPYQWSKMTVTENRGARMIVQIDEMHHLSGFHLPPTMSQLAKKRKILWGRKWLFCSGFSVVSQLPTATHLISKLCS